MSAVGVVSAGGVIQGFGYPQIEGLSVVACLCDDALVQFWGDAHVELAGVWLLRGFAT